MFVTGDDAEGVSALRFDAVHRKTLKVDDGARGMIMSPTGSHIAFTVDLDLDVEYSQNVATLNLETGKTKRAGINRWAAHENPALHRGREVARVQQHLLGRLARHDGPPHRSGTVIRLGEPMPDALSSLAFLYMTFGHSTDGSMSMDEMRALAKRLHAWAPEHDLQAIGEVIKNTVAVYKAEGDKMAKAKEHAAALKGGATAEQLGQVVTDLKEIANADGNISPEEQAFIDAMAADFGV